MKNLLLLQIVAPTDQTTRKAPRKWLIGLVIRDLCDFWSFNSLTDTLNVIRMKCIIDRQ